MATVNVLTYGAKRDDYYFDNAPAFLAALQAAGHNGTVVIPPGIWHIWTYPTYTGAAPTISPDPMCTRIEYHVVTDYYGNVSVDQMQKFLAYNNVLTCEYAWVCEGLGVGP